MAKHRNDDDIPPKAEPPVQKVEVVRNDPIADVNPDVAFRTAWKANKDNMRAVLTKTHEIRSGLRPSEIEKAQKILADYRF